MKKIVAVCVLCLWVLGGCCISHKWSEATCLEPKTCKECGKTEGEATGHNWTDATCTAASRCQNCGKERGKAKGHNVQEWTVENEATCQQEGLETGECANCSVKMERTIEKAAHVAGEWEIVENATMDQKGTRQAKCVVCGEIAETEEYELTGLEYEYAYKEKCVAYSYTDIARSPSQFMGAYAQFTGEVIQAQQSSFGSNISYVLRVNVTKSGSYYTYYSDTVYVTYTATEDAPRILEDDIIIMYGQLRGEKTYTTVMGSSVTLPLFEAEYIDIY